MKTKNRCSKCSCSGYWGYKQLNGTYEGACSNRDSHRHTCGHVPETGDFTTVYSEFKNTDKKLCLTDIMLKVETVPSHIKNYINRRYLTCVGYKLPAPIKSSMILKAGSKSEILDYLNDDSLTERISKTILDLNDNLLDV